MDYHDALLRDIRVLRRAELLLTEVATRHYGREDWQHLKAVAEHAAGMALARLGGLGAAW